MWRLAIPLILLTVVAWALLYGVRGKIAAETYRAVRQGAVVLTIAMVFIAAIFILFSLGGYING